MGLVPTKQGYEAKVFASATPGAMATTLWYQVTDVDDDADHDTGSQTARGDGSVPPIEYMAVTIRKAKAKIKLLNGGADDPILVAVLDRIKNGLAWHLTIKDQDDTLRFDFDVISPKKCARPLNKESTYEFEATPTLVGTPPYAGTSA